MNAGSSHGPARRRWLVSSLAIAAFAVAGCHKPPAPTPAARVAVSFAATPPTVGTNTFSLHVTDPKGQPVVIREIKVEGDMNHAGMMPSFATVTEAKPGDYDGRIDFTMGGDWILLVSGRLPGGERFEQKVAVPGVAAK